MQEVTFSHDGRPFLHEALGGIRRGWRPGPTFLLGSAGYSVLWIFATS
ncbi:hypothetical protein ACQEVX_00945 [Streptomyces syringium]